MPKRPKRGKPDAPCAPVQQLPPKRFGALRAITTIVDPSDELLTTGDRWSVE